MSKLSKTEKINEHHFNIETAKKYGVNKAILLYNLSYWLDHNKANKTNIHKHKGKKYYWTYNSAKAFEKLFPYFNKRSITRWLRELEEDGVIVSGEFNKTKYDRTKWYTMLSYSTTQNGKWVGQSGSPIPDSKPDSKHKSKSTSSCKKPNKLTRLRAVIDHFFKLKGWELDEEPYPRHIKAAETLHKKCGDDEKKAQQVLDNCKEKADKDQWSDWTIETSLAKFGDFRPVSKEEKRAKTALAHDIAVASSQHISLEELRAQRGY